MANMNRGGARKGAGRTPISQHKKKSGFPVYMDQATYEEVMAYGRGDSFSSKANELMAAQLRERRLQDQPVRFIDLFAGLGGLRIGFEQAFEQMGIPTRCVMTSEIKPSAVKALELNFQHEHMVGDITGVHADDIPAFDFLLAGFPCQAFSSAGKGHGFLDTRGTLFFEVERILREKKPFGFLLENVEGLVTHDRVNPKDRQGRTLQTILMSLRKLGYQTNWRVLDSQHFGLPQTRKRIYIVGTKDKEISLEQFPIRRAILKSVLEQGLPVEQNAFTQKIFTHFCPQELYGRSIKDKRGGGNNIHSWDIRLKGEVSGPQRELLERLLRERRKKHWAQKIGIDWMDGMPLTLKQIRTFYDAPGLKAMLDDLVMKGYLAYEHPKKRVAIPMESGTMYERVSDKDKPMGYNIVAGKLSFAYSQILDPNDVAPTLVAMDMAKLGVVDGQGIRRLTLREGLRLFGYRESYSLDFLETTQPGKALGFDLLGNTVSIPVVEAIAERLITAWLERNR